MKLLFKKVFSNKIIVSNLGDIIVSGKDTSVIIIIRETHDLFWYFPPLIDRTLPLRIFYPIHDFSKRFFYVGKRKECRKIKFHTIQRL